MGQRESRSEQGPPRSGLPSARSPQSPPRVPPARGGLFFVQRDCESLAGRTTGLALRAPPAVPAPARGRSRPGPGHVSIRSVRRGPSWLSISAHRSQRPPVPAFRSRSVRHERGRSRRRSRLGCSAPRRCAADTCPTDAVRGRYWVAGDLDGGRGALPLRPSGAPPGTSRKIGPMQASGRAWRSARHHPPPHLARARRCARRSTRPVRLPRVAAACRPAAASGDAYDRGRSSPPSLWHRCRAIDGTRAEAYLRARGTRTLLPFPGTPLPPRLCSTATAAACAGCRRMVAAVTDSRRSDIITGVHAHVVGPDQRPAKANPLIARARRSGACTDMPCASATPPTELRSSSARA